MVLATIADPSNAAPKPAKGKKTVEETYQKLTQHEHILQRPDTYVGSIEVNTHEMWCMDPDEGRMKQQKMSYVPGLYKIFDEILVNAADNKQRDSAMNELKVDIDRDTGRISVYNNGKGIPVVVHKEHGIYVPELIFGASRPPVLARPSRPRCTASAPRPVASPPHHLRRPLADEQQLRRQPEEGDRRSQWLRCAAAPLAAPRVREPQPEPPRTIRPSDGAVAGAGAKLANIFSSEFVVETADSASGKRFKQTFRDNMLTRGEPQIKPSKEDWTRISFVPDFAKFHMEACRPPPPQPEPEPEPWARLPNPNPGPAHPALTLAPAPAPPTQP
jgi:hypothetical protein